MGDFFPAKPFFFVLKMIVYRSALIPRKRHFPKKFLVTRLRKGFLIYDKISFSSIGYSHLLLLRLNYFHFN